MGDRESKPDQKLVSRHIVDIMFFYLLIVHPIQSSRTTQGRVLLREVVRKGGGSIRMSRKRYQLTKSVVVKKAFSWVVVSHGNSSEKKLSKWNFVFIKGNQWEWFATMNTV